MTRQRIALVLALLAVGFAVAFSIVRPQFTSSEVTWEPTSYADSGTFFLSRGAPERLDIETTCDKVRSADPAQPLLSAGSLTLIVEDDDLLLKTVDLAPPARVTLPPGDCEVHGAYVHGTSTASLTAGDASHSVEVARPRITTLVAPGDTPAVDRVVLRTQPTGITTSWFRWSLGLITLVLAAASLLLLSRGGSGQERGRPRDKLPRPRPVDGVVLVTLLGLAVLLPALFDDGWVLTRSGMLTDRWWFGNVFATNDAWLPQGFLHELVMAWLQDLGWGFAHLRLLVAVGLAGSWVTLRHYVLAPALGRGGSWPAAAAFVAVAGAWLITIRAEPVVVMSGTVTLACALSMARRPRPLVFATGIISAALAIGAHQSGWVVLGAMLYLLGAAFRAGRADRRRLPALLAAMAAAGSISLLTVFAAVDVRTAIAGAREFSTDFSYGGGMLAEPSRYLMVLDGQNTSARVFTVLLIGALAVIAALASGSNPARRTLWLTSLAWLGGLLLTSSKWPWHLGVYAVPAAILAALTADAWRQRGRPVGLGRVAVLPVIVLLAGMALRYAGRWGDADLLTLTWTDFSEGLVGGSRRIWWYAAIVVTAGLGLAADRGRLRRLATAAFAAAVLTPLAANAVWIALDSREPGWSLAGSNLRELSGDDDSCGALSDAEIVVGAEPLAESDTQPSGRKGALGMAPAGWPRPATVVKEPLDGEVPVWGTWFGTEEQPDADAQTGTMRSPEYVVTGSEPLTAWAVGGGAEGLAVRAVFSDEDGVVERTDLPLAEAPVWALHTLDPPAGATSVRMEVEDPSFVYGGWAAVSAPTVARTEPAAAVFEEASGYTTPFLTTQYPCVKFPDLSKGYWDGLDYTVAADSFFDQGAFVGLSVTQVLCRPGRDCVARFDYQAADITQRDIG